MTATAEPHIRVPQQWGPQGSVYKAGAPVSKSQGEAGPEGGVTGAAVRTALTQPGVGLGFAQPASQSWHQGGRTRSPGFTLKDAGYTQDLSSFNN